MARRMRIQVLIRRQHPAAVPQVCHLHHHPRIPLDSLLMPKKEEKEHKAAKKAHHKKDSSTDSSAGH